MSAPRKLSRTERTKRAADAFAWLRLLNSDRDPMAASVGVELLEFFNPDGEAWPGYDTLAKSLGVAETTIMRAIKRMHQRGRLDVAWGSAGSGHSNRYRMIIKPASAQVSEARKKPAPVQPKTCASASEPLKRTKIGEGEPKGSPFPLERENAPSALDSGIGAGPPAGRPPDLFEDHHPAEPIGSPPDPIASPPEPEILPPIHDSRHRTRHREAGGDVVAIDEQRAWRKLVELWDRGHSSDATLATARTAFARACAVAEGGAEEIVEGAEVWRAAFAAGDGLRFLPRLIDWISAESWKRPPPAKRKRQQRGAPRRGGSTGNMRMALKYGGYVEDEDGNLHHPTGGGRASMLYWRAGE
jgi:hypothetical protein